MTFDRNVNRSEVIAQYHHKPFPLGSESTAQRLEKMEISLLEDIQQGVVPSHPLTVESKLFIGMIPEHTTEQELMTLFQQYGSIVEVVIIKHGDRIAKGYGFCRYTKRCEAITAIQRLSGKTHLHVGIAMTFHIELAHTTRRQVCGHAEPEARASPAPSTQTSARHSPSRYLGLLTTVQPALRAVRVE